MVDESHSHYQILSELGRGGMGEVFLAEDTRLGRRVALKFLAPDLARDREALARFRNEARTVAELSHPHVATLHDIGERDGRPFLVFEYLEGETLRERIAKGPLPVDEVLRIGIAVASGLAAAHAKGIVHRDIKSSNVMLTEDGTVKVLDFGLAHRHDATQVTRPGATLGTVGYMSPEQARGEPADRRSDLWSLGVLLYECLTGRLPFEGDSAEAILHRVHSEAAEPPTARRTGIPLEVERTILRCLEKDADLRFQSAEDLLAALRLARRDSQDSASDATVRSAPSPATSARDRRPVLRLALIAAAVIAAVALALGLWPNGDDFEVDPTASSSERLLVVLPFSYQGPEDNAYLREGILDLLTVGLDAHPAVRTVDSHTLLKFLDSQDLDASSRAAAERALAKYGGELYVRGNILDTGNGVQLRAYLMDGQGLRGEQIDVALSEDQSLTAAVDLLTARVLANDALKLQGRIAGLAAYTTDSPTALRAFLRGEQLRRESFNEATEYFQAAVDADSTFALALLRLSEAVAWGNQDSLAIAYTRMALRHDDRLPAREQQALRAWSAHITGDARAAIERYRSYTRMYPDDIRGWKGLAESEHHLGHALGLRPEESRATWERVLKLQPGDWEAARHLGFIALREHRPEELASMIEFEQDYYIGFARLLLAGLRGESLLDTAVSSGTDLSLPTSRAALVNALSYLMRQARLPRLCLPELERIHGLETEPERLALVSLDLAKGLSIAGRQHESLAKAASARAGLPQLSAELESVIRVLPSLDWADNPSAPLGQLTISRELSSFGDLGPGSSVSRLRPVLAAALEATVVGQSDRASALIRQLEDHPAAPFERPILRAWIQGLRAATEMRDGNWVTARQLLSEIRYSAVFGSLDAAGLGSDIDQWGPISNLAVFRLMLGQALHRSGHHREAIGWLKTSAEIYRHDSALLLVSEREVASAYEADGDTVRAVAAHQNVVDWLEGCDEAFRPWRDDSRSALERLQASTH